MNSFFYHGIILIPALISNYIHYELLDEITYLFQNCNAAALGMDKEYHLTFYWAYDYLSTLGLKLIYGYSHHSSTELLPEHGSSSPWCSSILWLTVLLAGDWWWRHWEPFYLPYHEPPIVIEWQGHTCPFLLDTQPLREMKQWTSWQKTPSTIT